MKKEPSIKNTKGAAAALGCTENWIHKLVYAGRLKAYVYDEGVLVERSTTKRQGQGLYFYEADIKKYQASKHRRPGRPAGAKDKQPRRVFIAARNVSETP